MESHDVFNGSVQTSQNYANGTMRNIDYPNVFNIP